MLPPEALARAETESRRCDLMIVAGTSAEVYPAAALPQQAKAAGALVVEVNPHETPLLQLADYALRAGVVLWGLAGPADPAGLPWLALVLVALGLVTAPLANGFSRFVERQADDFALRLTRDPSGFIGAMERLASLNLAERRPHRLKELMLHSHPALDRRIARARAAQ